MPGEPCPCCPTVEPLCWLARQAAVQAETRCRRGWRPSSVNSTTPVSQVRHVLVCFMNSRGRSSPQTIPSRSFNQVYSLSEPVRLFLLPPQSFCPVMMRRRRMLITPAQEVPTGWTASPLGLQTLLTPPRRPAALEGE